ncbi:uncharacterized protein MYCFIDRAFT_210272 [Pseudocercospora fijiensis CIRAD86]|uniref:Uncharacterized protein n=1 Tax=Pseudocercospora fijiensis (strain CIRAD86) TaxID=383855 RepID=M3ALW7_PSEFD|nr:uncharacterized protein MYCFIDRAFT_210272 [Pseudocercospora fijiensis CIRAD86]EME85591.1 hypothetical protein MYCFIDRAFT_210272 [Pseudocercospora fijiensis CIRAD86]
MMRPLRGEADQAQERIWMWSSPGMDHVINTAALASQLRTTKDLSVRTVVYNKGTLNETELRSRFPADRELVIRNLDNVGREGHTYLSHLLGDSNDFSPHTMFIQAEPREHGYLQRRLQDYLVSNTGFLSLSYARNFCSDCDKCNDHSGWPVDGNVLRDVFERSNNGTSCGDISLTHRGQFVVSEERMKHSRCNGMEIETCLLSAGHVVVGGPMTYGNAALLKQRSQSVPHQSFVVKSIWFYVCTELRSGK